MAGAQRAKDSLILHAACSLLIPKGRPLLRWERSTPRSGRSVTTVDAADTWLYQGISWDGGGPKRLRGQGLRALPGVRWGAAVRNQRQGQTDCVASR